MNNTKVSVILPIHEYNENMSKDLIRSVNSVPSEYFLGVFYFGENDGSMDFILKIHENSEIFYIKEDKKKGISSNFSSIVNYGMDTLKTRGYEWAYILEYDDEFNNFWFEEVLREMNHKPDVSVFLPLTEILDYQTGKFISYGNEAPWASSFSNEIGYIDNESLQQFFDFYLTGSVFNLKDWVYTGGLKESFKLTFWYEFLLRLTHNGKKAFVIPKLGYKHYVNRPGSLFEKYRNEMDEDEKKWWYDLALEEYAYKKDRKKQYNK